MMMLPSVMCVLLVSLPYISPFHPTSFRPNPFLCLKSTVSPHEQMEIECLVDDTSTACIDDDLAHISASEQEEDARHAILVHCGEQALPPLPPPVVEMPKLWHEEAEVPSGYFEGGVSAMFNKHSSSSDSKMDAVATAGWLSKVSCFHSRQQTVYATFLLVASLVFAVLL